MKRTDITDLFPDASKEAIDKLMGINGADINAAKAELEALRTELTDKGAADGKQVAGCFLGNYLQKSSCSNMCKC